MTQRQHPILSTHYGETPHRAIHHLGREQGSMYTINIDALADKKTLEQSLEEFRRAPMQVVDSPKQVVVSTETHKQVLARELTEYVKKVDAMHLVDNSEVSGEELLLSLTQNGSITAAEYIQIKANLQN